MKNLEKYIQERITETNKNISVFKNKINLSHRVDRPNWVKNHTNDYFYYHGLLGELNVLNEIKSKLNEDGNTK